VPKQRSRHVLLVFGDAEAPTAPTEQPAKDAQ
jgi:hypothetical protein